MLGVLFLAVAGLCVCGLYATLRASRRSRLYLAEAPDAPLELGHLSDSLRRFGEDTRLLRISLDGPIRDIGDLRMGDFRHNAGQDLEVFDNMLINVSRDLAHWLQSVQELEPYERAQLLDMGLNADAIAAALAAEGGALEVRNLKKAGMPPLDKRLEAIREQLNRFETVLQLSHRIYR